MTEILSKRPGWPDKVHIVHMLWWCAFIFIEVVVAGAIDGNFRSIYYYTLFYTLNICLFYFHGTLVMPVSKSLNLLKLLKLSLLIIAEIGVYFLLSALTSLFLRDVLHIGGSKPLMFNLTYFMVAFYRAIFFITFGSGYYLLMEHLKEKDRKMEDALEIDRLNYQLLTMEKDYLRAQITPHLLFNTLDFIKTVSKTHPEKSDDAIDRLSIIMDYALRSGRHEFVALSEELEHIECMIELNLLRTDNRMQIRMQRKIENANVKIVPIILLTLVENIFKHGNLLDKGTPATIEISTNDTSIIFRTSNLIASTPPKKGKSTGLKNIAARLKNSYPDRHSFDITQNRNIFYTDLKIHL